MTRYKTILPDGYYIISNEQIKQYSGSTRLFVVGELYDCKDYIVTTGTIELQSYIASFTYAVEKREVSPFLQK